MNTDCKNKCENKNCENKTNSSYIKRIIKLIGPVILGSKPSEIVNIPGCPEEKIIKLNEIEAFFGNCKKVKYKIKINAPKPYIGQIGPYKNPRLVKCPSSYKV